MVSEQKKMKEEQHVATYRYAVPPSEVDVVSKSIDLSKRKPQDIMFDIAAKLNTLFMRTDSTVEEITRGIVEGKITPEQVRTAIDKKGNFTLSVQVHMDGEKYQVSVIVDKKGSVTATLTQGEGKEVLEVLNLEKKEILHFEPRKP